MGTNYYHRSKICGHCGRYDERHIGKTSAGWQFSFRGYTDDDGHRIIESWKQWKEILKKGAIFDEYNNQYSHDEFVAKVEATRDDQSHYDYARRDYGLSYLQDDWKDAEGWSFSTTEFS